MRCAIGNGSGSIDDRHSCRRIEGSRLTRARSQGDTRPRWCDKRWQINTWLWDWLAGIYKLLCWKTGYALVRWIYFTRLAQGTHSPLFSAGEYRSKLPCASNVRPSHSLMERSIVPTLL
jgi:hypothetical protein